MQEMGRIVAARKVKSLSERETELLKAINESIPTKLQVSYESLMLKLNNESISDDEHKDLLKLVAKMEAKKGKKVEYMMELAQLRKISLKELVQQLNANSFFYA
jgi:adenylate kinase family enzyme